MDCFEYPLDARYLLRKKKSLRRQLLAQDGPFLEKKVAVLGGSTTNEIVDQLELFLLNYGIKATFYQSEYAQYWQDAMFDNAELAQFAPDVIYIHTNWRNVTGFPTPRSTPEQAAQLLAEQYAHFEQMWESLARRYRCPIIQNNFERPNYRLMGNRDISDARGRSHFLSLLNQRFYDYAQSHANFYINDIDYLAADYGLTAWNDAFYWHMYKYALPLEAVPSLAKSVADIVKSLYGKNKKALVLDLDNTLWGGVVGDDGVEGIAIGPEVPYGQVYSEFQSYLKAHKDLGVLLAVNSKNDRENALAGLAHPDGVLRADDFVCIEANWENKDRNLLAIANQLDLGVDSFVFVDDNPAERGIVKAQLPGVAVPPMEKAEQYLRQLDHGGYFEVTAFSGDDLARNEMYKANLARKVQQGSFADYGEYLQSLQMKAVIRRFEPLYLQRIAQLTNKSNQFNLTTLRCTEAEITAMSQDADCLCLYGKLEDKFGDNGVVSVVAGRRSGDRLELILWLMSCRVLKRGMEDAMMDAVLADAKAAGVKTVVGHYYPTPKNGMVKDFYQRMGFALTAQQPDGSSEWEQAVAEYQPKQPHIEIER